MMHYEKILAAAAVAADSAMADYEEQSPDNGENEDGMRRRMALKAVADVLRDRSVSVFGGDGTRKVVPLASDGTCEREAEPHSPYSSYALENLHEDTLNAMHVVAAMRQQSITDVAMDAFGPPSVRRKIAWLLLAGDDRKA